MSAYIWAVTSHFRLRPCTHGGMSADIWAVTSRFRLRPCTYARTGGGADIWDVTDHFRLRPFTHKSTLINPNQASTSAPEPSICVQSSVPEPLVCIQGSGTTHLHQLQNQEQAREPGPTAVPSF